jgi:hypothetical protein
VEEPEVIFSRIAGLNDSNVGSLRLNSHALIKISNSVKETRKEVRGKNNEEIAAEMLSLSRKKVFVHALSELSNVT